MNCNFCKLNKKCPGFDGCPHASSTGLPLFELDEKDCAALADACASEIALNGFTKRVDRLGLMFTTYAGELKLSKASRRRSRRSPTTPHVPRR